MNGEDALLTSVYGMKTNKKKNFNYTNKWQKKKNRINKHFILSLTTTITTNKEKKKRKRKKKQQEKKEEKQKSILQFHTTKQTQVNEGTNVILTEAQKHSHMQNNIYVCFRFNTHTYTHL